MEEQDYPQFIDTAARNRNLNQEDLDFLSTYFDKTMEKVTEDIISRQTIIQLAWFQCQHLN